MKVSTLQLCFYSRFSKDTTVSPGLPIARLTMDIQQTENREVIVIIQFSSKYSSIPRQTIPACDMEIVRHNSTC